ncbi:MAG: hypothetical protein V6006_00785 [Candidatus Dasytiphilus stammeri]
MLSITHGPRASSLTGAKELVNVVFRMERPLGQLKKNWSILVQPLQTIMRRE